MYVEAAISSLGVSNDQLMMNVVVQLKEQVIKINTIPWLPCIHGLEREEDLNEVLLKLITWSKNPNISAVNDRSPVRSIAFILISYIIVKRTAFEINFSVFLHGLTKSMEKVDEMDKEDWPLVTMMYLCCELSSDRPFEPAGGKPAINIVENNDFKSDTLTRHTKLISCLCSQNLLSRMLFSKS